MVKCRLDPYLMVKCRLDPYLSRVDPLPHQLEAIYDYLLKLARVRSLCRSS